MPKIICKCNEVLDYGNIPSPIDYLFISDIDYADYEDEVDSEVLYKHMKIFLKCPKCNRLWFFWDGMDKKPIEYKKVD